MAFDTSRREQVEIVSIPIGESTITNLMTALTAIREQLSISAFLLMQIVTVHTGERAAFLIATAAHQTAKLIGTMRVIVAWIARIEVDGDPLCERFARAICECRAVRFASSRMALRANLIRAIAGEISRVDDGLCSLIVGELSMVFHVVASITMTTDASHAENPSSRIVTIDRPRGVREPGVMAIETT